MLAWLVHERNIQPHIPVVDKSSRGDSTFEHAAFRYDLERDVSACLGGEKLRRYWHEGRPANKQPRSTSLRADDDRRRARVLYLRLSQRKIAYGSRHVTRVASWRCRPRRWVMPV